MIKIIAFIHSQACQIFSTDVVYLFFLSFASADGMFSRQLGQKWESTYRTGITPKTQAIVFVFLYWKRRERNLIGISGKILTLF